MSEPMAAVSLVDSGAQRRSLPAFVRYPLAVVAGAITGEAIGLPVAFLLDVVYWWSMAVGDRERDPSMRKNFCDRI
jgi:hypothetical protein